jgi:hypothetical protein
VRAAARAVGFSGSMPVEAGEQGVTASIEATFALEFR